MAFAITLSLYVSRVFSIAVLNMLAGLSGLVALFDFIELLRRSATKPDATFAIVTEIAGLRLPWVAMQILPFAVLLGGILAFWRLTRSSELIVARAAGVSAWQFLTGPIFCAVLFGAFATTVVSPVSAVMRAQAESLDDTYLRVGNGPLSVNGGQLWLRQSDHGYGPNGVAFLHALDGRPGGRRAARARRERVPARTARTGCIARLEASRARLGLGTWILDDAPLDAGGPAAGRRRAPSACRRT